MKIIPGILIFAAIFSCHPPIEIFSNADRQEILKVLSDQQEAWNKADIEQFMEGYWKSDSLQFIGSEGISYGWNTTLEGYKRRYPGPEAMGKLDFKILQVQPLSAKAAFITGRFHLQRTIGNLSGIFTLILKEIDGKWLVVYDHTSGEE